MNGGEGDGKRKDGRHDRRTPEHGDRMKPATDIRVVMGG